MRVHSTFTRKAVLYAKQLDNQSAIAHALDMISMNVADGRLRAGMVGLIKSGKSTTLNALMKNTGTCNSVVSTE